MLVSTSIKYISYPTKHVVLVFMNCFFLQDILLLQVFQLTTLVIRGPATRGEKFVVSLDRVAVKEEEVRCVLLCVWDFVRSPHFAQRRFFSESGLTMLPESTAIADSITSSPVYAPWSNMESACADQVITDLCASWDRSLLRRCTAKDTLERWYHGGTLQNETASRPRVRNSDVGGPSRKCASCFACSWSSWAKQNSFFPAAGGREKSLGAP